MESSKNVIIFQGGWDGHEPELVAQRIKRMVEKHGYSAEIFDSQEILADRERLMAADLIVPCWTMGEILPEYCRNISSAVAAGTGLAGCHGGMCDAFRQDVEWQFMTGGQWVSHPGCDGVDYTVNICRGSSPIVEGIEDFHVCSEQYYLHVDPAVEVLATTRFPVVNGYHCANKPVDMPVAWTKFWGNGRVFYCSLGHHDDVFEKSPEAGVLMERGLIWAAQGKQYALEHGLTTDRFEE
ncbi:MAG TPA: ThuA domain-containing protein [Candidatus Egerieimonas faecigallinarum]|nr:ThuA domain-containing protein [Candidatus Egerieimonas faecigallinarum]